MLRIVRDFFQAPYVPQNPEFGYFPSRAPIRHGGEGGGGPTAGEAGFRGPGEPQRQRATRREV